MTDVQIGSKTYSLAFTMLSVVRSKALTGEGFFELSSKEDVGSGEQDITAEQGMEKVLNLFLLALQTNHAEEFTSIEDVARAFPTMSDIAAVTPFVNAALVKFLAVDENLQKRLADAQKAKGRNAKKKSQRSTTSPKTSTQQNAESASA